MKVTYRYLIDGQLHEAVVEHDNYETARDQAKAQAPDGNHPIGWLVDRE